MLEVTDRNFLLFFLNLLKTFYLILGGCVVGVNGGRGHTPLVPLHLLIQLQTTQK
jgi:hypothetical protein